jgi:hypothetical protein
MAPGGSPLAEIRGPTDRFFSMTRCESACAIAEWFPEGFFQLARICRMVMRRTTRPNMRERVIKCEVAILLFLPWRSQSAYQTTPIPSTRSRKDAAE